MRAFKHAPRAWSSLSLTLLLAACAGESQEELPFDVVSLGLYSEPLAERSDGTYRVTYGGDGSQFAEVAILPDRGLFVFLVAGTMTLRLPERPKVGSTLSMQELELKVSGDDFLPGGWMSGAEMLVQEAEALCVESTDAGARWRWQSVGALTITTRDGQGQLTLPWRPRDEYVGSTSSTNGKLELYPPFLQFAREGSLP